MAFLNIVIKPVELADELDGLEKKKESDIKVKSGPYEVADE